MARKKRLVEEEISLDNDLDMDEDDLFGDEDDLFGDEDDLFGDDEDNLFDDDEDSLFDDDDDIFEDNKEDEPKKDTKQKKETKSKKEDKPKKETKPKKEKKEDKPKQEKEEDIRIKYHGPRKVIVYGREVFTENNTDATFEDIRKRLVEEFKYEEFADKERMDIHFDAKTGEVFPMPKLTKKG